MFQKVKKAYVPCHMKQLSTDTTGNTQYWQKFILKQGFDQLYYWTCKQKVEKNKKQKPLTHLDNLLLKKHLKINNVKINFYRCSSGDSFIITVYFLLPEVWRHLSNKDKWDLGCTFMKTNKCYTAYLDMFSLPNSLAQEGNLQSKTRAEGLMSAS